MLSQGCEVVERIEGSICCLNSFQSIFLFLLFFACFPVLGGISGVHDLDDSVHFVVLTQKLSPIFFMSSIIAFFMS